MKIQGNHLKINDMTVVFHRTLRLPEDGETHSLPPSLGEFPLRRVDDFKDKVPAAWREHGGVFFPLYQREAMWIAFSTDIPRAVKVAAGKINAVSGGTWTETLEKFATREDDEDPEQDYMVSPPQPWLDGFNVGKGIIRQFIAMPLGRGYTVEGQVTGEETFGGIQMLVIKPKKGGPADVLPRGRSRGLSGMTLDASLNATNSWSKKDVSKGGGEFYCSTGSLSAESVMDSLYRSSETVMRRRISEPVAAEMGLAQGGQMKQKIYSDPYGVDAWDTKETERCYVHIVNSELWKEITGEDAPATPISAKTYTDYGFPWYALYDEHVPAVKGSGTLANVATVSEIDDHLGIEDAQDDSPIKETNVITQPVEEADKETVRDGTW